MPLLPLPISFDGGVNLIRDPSAIQPGQVPYAKNFYPVRPGVLGTRPACKIVQDLHGLAGSGFYVLSFIRALLDGKKANIWFAGSASQAIQIGLCWDGAQTLSGNLVSDFFSDDRPALVPYMGKVYAFFGVGAPHQGRIIKNTDQAEPDAATIFAFQGLNNDGIRPACAAVYKDRMFYANLGTAQPRPRMLIWADPGDPTLLSDDQTALNGRNIPIGEGRGDDIVALHTIGIAETGASLEKGMLILCTNSAWLGTGSPPLTSEPATAGDFVVDRLSLDASCISKETVVTTPYGTFWVGHDDVWMFAYGHTPVRVGTNIREALLGIPAGARKFCSAAYHNGVYRISILSPEQGGVNPASGNGVGEKPWNQWWLDLRDGPPRNADEAQWWGPMDFSLTDAGSSCLFLDDLPGSPPTLYGMAILNSSVDTPAARYYLQQYDLNDWRDEAPESFSPNGSPNDVGIVMGIEGEIWTPEMFGDDPMVNKRHRGMELSAWVSQGTRLTVDIVSDGGREIESDTVDVEPQGFRADVDTMDTERLTHEYQALLVAPVPTHVNYGKRIQLRLKTASGILTGVDSDEISFRQDGVDFVATLLQDFYTDLASYRLMITGQLTAAVAATFPGISYSSSIVAKKVRISYTGASAAFTFHFTAGPATAAQRRKTRIVGAILGFDTSADQSGSSTEIDAAVSVFQKPAARCEFAALATRMSKTGRRPR